MSDALLIAVVATGFVAILVGAVTWMLVLPARASRAADRVLPLGEPPLTRATLLADRTAVPGAPTCEDPEAADLATLRDELRQAEDADQDERATRIAQVLVRRGADEPEVRAVAAHPAASSQLSRIEDAAWLEELAAPGLEPSLTGLMALLGPEAITWQAFPASRYGLSRRQRVESLTLPPPLAAVAAEVATAVGVPTPVMYVTPENPARLLHVNLAVAGRFAAALAIGAEALDVQDEAAMRFMLGRKLTFMRAEHLLCTAVDGPEDLRALHLATAQILDPGTLPEAPDIVLGLPREAALLRLREHFHQAERASLARRLLRAAVEQAEDPDDPAAVQRWERWLVAAAETSFRCGLLVSGDLTAALSILDRDDVIPGTDRQHDQCYIALDRFYLSEAFASLRRALQA